ncbi:MAG: hypothetical protein J7L89_05595 [Bacteroidales bacterium]|nr:hypothetical protein [Bacteroidales bacterium]
MMQVGTARIDITPDPGVELMGFARRDQPSDRRLDPLEAKILYLGQKHSRMILIALDLIGVEGDFVSEIRQAVAEWDGGDVTRVMVFATHTHSGPGTVNMNGCGAYRPEYLPVLKRKILKAVKEVLPDRRTGKGGKIELCRVETGETDMALGVNRRNGKNRNQHLKWIQWVCEDGTLKAVLVNYAMHPVCLRTTGISADYPGAVCRILEKELPGNPLVQFGLGPCGDIDPPGVGVDYRQMEKWAHQLAGKVITKYKSDKLIKRIDHRLTVVSRRTPIAMNYMTQTERDKYAARYLNDRQWTEEFGENFVKAVREWKRKSRRQKIEEVEISVVRIGDVVLLFVSAELFSAFTHLIKIHSKFIMVISCSNGVAGYLPDQTAYAQGGYEIETALFFYNTFLPKKGSLEQIATAAKQLIHEVLRDF